MKNNCTKVNFNVKRNFYTNQMERTQYETEGFYQLLTLYMIQCRDD